MHGLPKTYQAAVIGIDPKTGRVLGYYGGDDPTGTDYGGYMNGDGTGFSGGGQSPGSTFKIYTLAAGAEGGHLLQDHLGRHDEEGRTATKISNAGADAGQVCGGKIKYCDLETATVKSYNFPFYWIADGIGRGQGHRGGQGRRHRAHVDTDERRADRPDQDRRRRLEERTSTTRSASASTGLPLEHAQGVATIVNNGVHHKAHFIKSVKQRRPEDRQVRDRHEREQLKPASRSSTPDQMSDLDGVLEKIPGARSNTLRNGREAIAQEWHLGVQTARQRRQR